MKKNKLQVKKSVLYYINFGNEPENWILEKDAIKVKNELEMDGKF